MFHLYLGIIWAVLGLVQLYRVFSGQRQGKLLTLTHYDAMALSRNQRWFYLASGACFSAIAVTHFAMAWVKSGHTLP